MILIPRRGTAGRRFSSAVHDHATQSVAVCPRPHATRDAAVAVAGRAVAGLREWYGENASYLARVYDDVTGRVVWEEKT